MAHSLTSFTASPTIINKGSSTTLRWNIVGAYGLTASPLLPNSRLIEGEGSGSFSLSASPTRTTIFTLSVRDPELDPAFIHRPSFSRQITVTVLEIAVIDSFSGPSAIDHGASATLVWKTTNATIVSIPGVLSSSSNVDGSISVSPTETKTYTLRARNTSSGRVVTKDVTVTVRDPVIIKPPTPTLAVSITGTTSDVNEGISRRFRASITGTGVGTTTYSWSVDGDATIRGSSTSSSVLVRANQVGSSGGSYSVSVEVTRGELDADDTTSDISVIDTTATTPTTPTLTAAITGSTSAINEDEERSFSVSVGGTAIGVISYSWSVDGDANRVSTTQSSTFLIRASQVGSSGGSFTVSVTVRRQSKSADDTTSDISVIDTAGPITPPTTTVTTEFDYIWIIRLSFPNTPVGVNTFNHRPSGWTNDRLYASNIGNVYRCRREETFRNRVFRYATNWEEPTLQFARLDPRVYSGSSRINLSSGSPRVRRIYIGNSQVSER